MKALYFLVFLLVFVLIFFFSLLNLDPVKLYYYKGYSFEAPLVMIMACQLALGVLLGLAVGFAANLRLKAKTVSLQRKLRLQAENMNDVTPAS